MREHLAAGNGADAGHADRKLGVAGAEAAGAGEPAAPAVSTWPRPRRGAVAAYVGFAFVEIGYAIWVAFVGHGWVGPRVGYGPDSAVYVAAARAPVWSRHFLAGPGPFGFLLLAKACARNLRAVVVVQSIVAVAAWGFLATTLAGMARSNLARRVAFAGVLGVALAPGVLQWNAMIVTESLSLSALCAVVACAFRLVGRGTRREAGWFLVALAAFAYTRDTNALVAGGIGVVALACAVRPAWRVRAVALGAVGIVLALSATALADAARPPRWYWPVAETTAIRLLAEPDAARYLVAHGFPWDAHMRTLPQRYVYLYVPVTRGPQFAAFREWIRRDGRRVYVDYLLSHPGWALREPFDDRDRLLDISGVEGYGRLYHNRPGGPFTLVGAIAAPPSPAVMEIWASAAALALVVLVVRRRVCPALAGVASLVGLFAIVGYYAAWHGDALEVNRHALTAGVELHLACWIAAALVIDAVIAPPLAADEQLPGHGDLDDEECACPPRREAASAAVDARKHHVPTFD